MKPIRWTKKRKDQLRYVIHLAWEGWQQASSETCSHARMRANDIHEFEVFLNSKGLCNNYDIPILTERIKEGGDK